jgi:zinc protease
MNRLFVLFAAVVLALQPVCRLAAQNENPLKVTRFTLDNGLTVMLNEDRSKPEIFGAVAVRAGSKHDPADATGIAHYFEHIMFKGTDKIGTLDYASEKIYLDSISFMYDSLARTLDENVRKQIHLKINGLSIRAADFAIPNEVDVLLRDIGSSGLNAYTSFEETVYHNSFPSNQMEKWLEIYAERFRNPVFRLFQAELETVYEEKNMYADNPVSTMFEDVLATLYKNHPYGRPLIGTKEHLKNPRLSKMLEFFQTYYVANNMALILCGDFDSEAVIPVITEKFGTWRSGELPDYTEFSEEPFKGRESKNVKMTPVRIGVLGYRAVPNNHPDEVTLKLCNEILSNESSTGLLDKLVMDNQMLMASAMSLQGNDLGTALILFVPKIIGQSFQAADDLVRAQLDSLKKGRFSEELLEAIKLNYRKRYLMNLESVDGRANMLVEAFVKGTSWEEMLEEIHQIEKVTKKDIIRVAHTYFGEDHLAYWSNMGFPKKDKIKKPDWEPVLPKNTEARSRFAEKLEQIPETPAEPRFIDFANDLQTEPLGKGYLLYAIKNPYNDVFSLTITYKTGKLGDPLLEMAAGFMELIGTEDMTYQEFRSELQRLGASLFISVKENYLELEIDGFEENLAPILKLVNELLTRPKSDEKQLEKFIQSAKANYKMMKQDPATLGDALFHFALYKNQSPYLRQLSLKEVKALKGADLIRVFSQARKHEAVICYSGKMEAAEVGQALREHLPFETEPVPGKYIELLPESISGNTVYTNHFKKALQCNIYFFAGGNEMMEKDKALVNPFNEYFGTGMSSLVFQEIREFRSLSYAAYASFRIPYYRQNPGSISGYMGTQADKTIEGVQVMYDLFSGMPQKPERMEGIRKAMLQSVFTEQPGFRDLPATVARWQERGYERDPREYRYSVYREMTFDDIVAFYRTQLAKKPLLITVSGNLKGFSAKDLEKFGTVVNIKQQQIIKQ